MEKTFKEMMNMPLVSLSMRELDDLACYLAGRRDNLEQFGTDYNGDWIDQKAKREWREVNRLLGRVDEFLECFEGD